MACGAVLLLILLAIVFAPLIAPHDPYQGSMAARLKPIGTEGHVLGTDELGRDMLARLLYGGRLSGFLGIVPRAGGLRDRFGAGHPGGLRRRLGQHGHHAHHRRLLRLSLGAAGRGDQRRARAGHVQRDDLC